MFFLTLRALRASALLLLIASTALAQRDRDSWTGGPTVEVSGQVRLVGEAQPARNVSVRLERLGGGTVDQMTTDNLGKFRFQGLQRGVYNIIVSAEGYNPTQQQIDLQVVLRSYLVFDLVPEKIGAEMPAMVLDVRVPQAAQKEFELARSAYALKNTKQALEHLERAVMFYADFFEAQFLRGTIYISERRWKEAEDALRGAVKAKPDAPAALFALGEVYRREKRYKDAEKVLLEGLKLDENSWQGHFTLGRVYWEMGDERRAAQSVGRTLQLRPAFAEAHLLAGNILLRFNEPNRALFEFEEYLRLAPKGEFAAQASQLVRKLKTSLAEKKR